MARLVQELQPCLQPWGLMITWSTEMCLIRTIEDGVAKDYGVHYNYNQLNLTLYKVQYICIYRDYRDVRWNNTMIL